MTTAQTTVEYRDIPGLAGYRAGSDGTIWSSWVRGSKGTLTSTTWVMMKPWLLSPKKKYLALRFKLGGKSFLVHRLIAAAFIGPCPDGYDCCHANRDTRDNRPENLRYDTRKGNMADTVLHKTRRIGVKVAGSKLTDDSVRAMRTEHAAGGISYSKIGKKYGVSYGAAYWAINRGTWKHVT